MTERKNHCETPDPNYEDTVTLLQSSQQDVQGDGLGLQYGHLNVKMTMLVNPDKERNNLAPPPKKGNVYISFKAVTPSVHTPGTRWLIANIQEHDQVSRNFTT